MHFAMYLIYLITIFVLPPSHSQDGTPSNPSSGPPITHHPPVTVGLGESGCVYFGGNDECNLPKVDLTRLPKECTSILFMDVRVDKDFVVGPKTQTPSGDEDVLRIVANGTKPSLAFYGHGNINEWSIILFNNSRNDGINAKAEMVNLKAYLDNFPGLDGIIIKDLTFDPSTDNIIEPELTKDFIVYIEEMKRTFPNFGIGLDLQGNKLLNFVFNHESEWLNFEVLDQLIDFYTIDVHDLVACTVHFKIGDPKSGDTQALTDLVGVITSLGIPSSKTYFLYGTAPISYNADDLCEDTKTKFCASPSLDGWCADNTQSYFDKGKLAKAYGAGFIVLNLDLADDPDGTCDCGRPYPGFNDILDGFNGAPLPLPCAKLDKP